MKSRLIISDPEILGGAPVLPARAGRSKT